MGASAPTNHDPAGRRGICAAVRGLSARDWWMCGLIGACFAWPALVTYVRETALAVVSVAQAPGLARGIALLVGVYGIITYTLARVSPRRWRVGLAIAVALVVPICLQALLSGVIPAGLRPSASWLGRIAVSIILLYLVARFLRRRHLLYVVAAFVIITTAIAWRHYYHGDWIVDLFMFRQALWTTLHGQGFFHVSDEGGSHFGTHNTPLLFLFLPLYAIWDSGALLLLCQSAAVGLTAYPMYHIARARVDEPRAMVLAVGFLLLVPVIGPTLTWFKELPFALPLFAAALAAFEERRLKGFAAWSGSLLVVRETLAVTLVLFGLYAAVRRRSWRWVALPAALGLAWGALSFGVIMPRFFVPGQSNRPFLALYKGLGESMPEVLLTAATHPRLAAARLNTHENRQYLERLTRPCGRFLPLGSVLTVFAIPDGLAVGLARHRAWPTHELAANYHVIMIAALVAAFVCTVAGLTQRLGLSAAPLHLALGLFFISAVTDALPVLYDPPRAQVWPPDLVRARREIVALVPPQASVAATYCTLTQLAHRREIYPAVPLVRESEGVRQISPDVMVLMGEVENRKLMERMRQEGYRLAAERPPFTLWAKPGVALPR